MCLNGTYSNACMGKRLSHAFPIQNCLKQCLSFLYNLTSENAIRKVQET
jgi:hypothetical protein